MAVHRARHQALDKQAVQLRLPQLLRARLARSRDHPHASELLPGALDQQMASKHSRPFAQAKHRLTGIRKHTIEVRRGMNCVAKLSICSHAVHYRNTCRAVAVSPASALLKYSSRMTSTCTASVKSSATFNNPIAAGKHVRL